MLVEPLVQRDEIAEAFATYQSHLYRKAMELQGDFYIGWQGEGRNYKGIHWHQTNRMWSLLTSRCEVDKYWCCYGLEEPWSVDSLSIVCEMNMPMEGVNRRMGGVFVRDESGQVYLTHNGKIGGGKPGVGKSAFLEAHNFRGKTAWSVAWPDGEVTGVIVVARIDDANLPDKVAKFVREVDKFKHSV